MSSSNTSNNAAAKRPATSAFEVIDVDEEEKYFGENVLGRVCLVLFDTDDVDSNGQPQRRPFRGVVHACESTLKLVQNKNAEQNNKKEADKEKPVESKRPKRSGGSKKKQRRKQSENKQADTTRKPRTTKFRLDHTDNWRPVIERLHHVVFGEDFQSINSEEMWLDLAHLHQDGRLWWHEDAKTTQLNDSKKKAKVKQEENKAANPVTAFQPAQPQLQPPMLYPMNMMLSPPQQQQHLLAMQQQFQQWAQRSSTTVPPLDTGYGTAMSGAADATAATGRALAETATPTKAAASPEKKQATAPANLGSIASPATPTTAKKERRKRKNSGPTSSGFAWVDDMRHYLLHVPHGRNNKVASHSNAQSIIRQICKLAKGEGVTIKKGDPSIFYQGVAIDLKTTDVDKLWNDVVEFHKVHPDTSGGYALRHPIRHYLHYVKYRKEHPEGAIVAAKPLDTAPDEATRESSPIKQGTTVTPTGGRQANPGTVAAAPIVNAPKATSPAKTTTTPKTTTAAAATLPMTKAATEEQQADKTVPTARPPDPTQKSPPQTRINPALGTAQYPSLQGTNLRTLELAQQAVANYQVATNNNHPLMFGGGRTQPPHQGNMGQAFYQRPQQRLPTQQQQQRLQQLQQQQQLQHGVYPPPSSPNRSPTPPMDQWWPDGSPDFV